MSTAALAPIDCQTTPMWCGLPTGKAGTIGLPSMLKAPT